MTRLNLEIASIYNCAGKYFSCRFSSSRLVLPFIIVEGLVGIYYHLLFDKIYVGDIFSVTFNWKKCIQNIGYILFNMACYKTQYGTKQD